AGARLVLRIRRKRRDGKGPEAIPLAFVLDLAHPHRTRDGLIAKLDLRIGAQIVDPDRIPRRSALRRNKDVTVAVLDTHERRFANGTGLVTRMRDDDHGQAGVAQGGPFRPATAFIELDLLAHPVSGAWDVFGHAARPLFRFPPI